MGRIFSRISDLLDVRKSAIRQTDLRPILFPAQLYSNLESYIAMLSKHTTKQKKVAVHLKRGFLS